jgi:cation/acetate symporter
VVAVAALGALYVAFGGMLAATWVQMVKAVLLLAAVVFLAGLVLAASGGELYARAAAIHPLGEGLFRGGGLKLDLVSSLSLSAGLILGMLGLPHLLVRLLTVPDEATAKRSLVVATVLIGAVFALILAVLGPGVVAHVTGVPAFLGPDGKIAGGGNMAIMHLARALGGAALFGIMAAVAFATILAVVAGLTVAAATALSHDLLKPGSEKAELATSASPPWRSARPPRASASSSRRRTPPSSPPWPSPSRPRPASRSCCWPSTGAA